MFGECGCLEVVCLGICFVLWIYDVRYRCCFIIMLLWLVGFSGVVLIGFHELEFWRAWCICWLCSLGAACDVDVVVALFALWLVFYGWSLVGR